MCEPEIRATEYRVYTLKQYHTKNAQTLSFKSHDLLDKKSSCALELGQLICKYFQTEITSPANLWTFFYFFCTNVFFSFHKFYIITVHIPSKHG